MMALQPAPKFEKVMHHVVPAAWQKRFASSGDPGPYYHDVITGKRLPAQGPGDKMSERYANIVFDEHFRPSDKLEDAIGVIESKAIPSLDRTIGTSAIDPDARVDLAYFLAVQACRYPELFQRRLDMGKYLAIALKDSASCPDVASVNSKLQSTGLLPGAAITPQEFETLKAASESSLATEIDHILRLHGYEAYFNPELVIAAALPVAEHLLALQWSLVESDKPAFILCDRPMPTQIKYGFKIGLSSRLGLRVSMPTAVIDELPIKAEKVTADEIEAINNDVRARTRQWICGPDASLL